MIKILPIERPAKKVWQKRADNQNVRGISNDLPPEPHGTAVSPRADVEQRCNGHLLDEII